MMKTAIALAIISFFAGFIAEYKAAREVETINHLYGVGQ